MSHIGISQKALHRAAMTERASLNVSLTPKLVAFVNAPVASGRYAGASEVVGAVLCGIGRDGAIRQRSAEIVSS